MLLTDLFSPGSRTEPSGNLDRLNGELLNDPAPDWRYLVRFPEILGVTSPMSREWVVAETFTFTHPSIPSQGRHGGGSMTYFPDFNDIAGSSITLYEDQYYSALFYIMQWRKLIIDDQGNYGVSNFYKKDLKVEAYSYQDSKNPVMVGTLHGTWPSEVSAFEYSYEGQDRIKVQVEFSVDAGSVDFVFLGKSQTDRQRRDREPRNFFDIANDIGGIAGRFIDI